MTDAQAVKVNTPDDVFAYVENNTRLAIERVFCGRKHRVSVDIAAVASRKVAKTILSSAGKHKDSQTFFYALDSMKEYFGPTEDTILATRKILTDVGLEAAANVAGSVKR